MNRLALAFALALGATVAGPVAPDGTEVACDLPKELQIRNKGGLDGAGLCVFASINHSAHWQDVLGLGDFFEWMRKYPGGGWPEKVDKMIAKRCKELNVPIPPYIQVEGKDIEVLKLACKTGRMPAVTYSFSPSGRYGGQRIAHMVTLVHADEKWFGILDNNYPGSIEWMSSDEFRRTYAPGGRGWAVIFLDLPPPPVPKN